MTCLNSVLPHGSILCRGGLSRSAMTNLRLGFGAEQSTLASVMCLVASMCLPAEVPPLAVQSTELGDDRPIWACQFSPSGTELATAAWSGLVKLWTLPACQKTRTIKAHDNRITGGRQLRLPTQATSLQLPPVKKTTCVHLQRQLLSGQLTPCNHLVLQRAETHLLPDPLVGEDGPRPELLLQCRPCVASSCWCAWSAGHSAYPGNWQRGHERSSMVCLRCAALPPPSSVLESWTP